MPNETPLAAGGGPCVGMGTVAVDPAGLKAELTAARARIEKLEGALFRYGDDFCGGLCFEYGPHEDFDCSGCAAKLALKP